MHTFPDGLSEQMKNSIVSGWTLRNSLRFSPAVPKYPIVKKIPNYKFMYENGIERLVSHHTPQRVLVDRFTKTNEEIYEQLGQINMSNPQDRFYLAMPLQMQLEWNWNQENRFKDKGEDFKNFLREGKINVR